MPDVVKVTLNGNTLIDISDSTVQADKVLSSYIGYEGDGDRFVGTYTPSGGGGSTDEKDVIFIDYDGTIVHEYTKSEFLDLSALPSNPDHTSEGLVSQGWNWTLSDAKAYVTSYGMLVIGQSYDTSDTNTKFYITIPNDNSNELKSVRLQFITTASGIWAISWGDNTASEHVGNGTVAVEHTYQNAGDYVITITNTSPSSSSTCTLSGTNTTAVTPTLGLDRYLTKVQIGSSTFNAISSNAFMYCSKLESITLPTSIRGSTQDLANGTYIFTYCSSLKAMTYPSGVTKIGQCCFEHCTRLKYISIPKSLTTCDSRAFENCSSLEVFCFPDNTYAVNEHVFRKAVSLVKVVIPSSLDEIGQYAFYYCSKLKTIDLSLSVANIRQYAFQWCTSLESITFSNSLRTIATYAFSYCNSLKNVIIPSGVTSIGSSAFYYCESLETVTINASITAMPSYGFAYCTRMRSINIPSTVTSISAYAFQYNYGIDTLFIPSGVTTISSNAFTYMESLTRIYIYATTPPKLSSGLNAYSINRGDMIFVPYGCGEVYKAATGWSSYASYIYEMDEE